MPEGLELQTEEIVDNTAAETAPEPVEKTEPEKPLSLREQLAKAIESTETVEPEKKTTRTANRVRNPDGTLAPSVKAEPAPEVTAQQPVKPAVEPPQALPSAIKAKWAELPPEVQQAWAQREKEVHEGFTKLDEERNFGKALKSVIEPYMPMIRSEGSDPLRAVTSLFDTAYRLRQGTPQQKGQLIGQLAREFGADLSVLQQQQQPNVDPMLQRTWQELQSLKQERQQEVLLQKQQQEEALAREIQAFAARPESVHYETVKQHMVSILSNNLAKGETWQDILQDAYDQAVYANPQTRSTLLQSQQANSEAKRVADIKAKADAAKKAGSSLKTSAGRAVNGTGAAMAGNLRAQLENAWREANS